MKKNGTEDPSYSVSGNNTPGFFPTSAQQTLEAYRTTAQTGLAQAQEGYEEFLSLCEQSDKDGENNSPNPTTLTTYLG